MVGPSAVRLGSGAWPLSDVGALVPVPVLVLVPVLVPVLGLAEGSGLLRERPCPVLCAALSLFPANVPLIPPLCTAPHRRHHCPRVAPECT